MFQLIVAVISIALVAALAIASIYYGGSAFSSSSLRANVVTLVNGGQQIAGAQALYVTDNGTGAQDIQNLLNNNGIQYLSAVPSVSVIAKDQVWDVDSTGKFAIVALAAGVDAAKVCDEVTKQAGSTFANGAQFYCADSTGAAAGTTHFAFKL